MKPRVCVALVVKPGFSSNLTRNAYFQAAGLPDASPGLDMTLVLCHAKIEPAPTDATPWAKVTRARNLLLDQVNIANFDYFLWIDADIVWYPPALPRLLLEANPAGMTAPMVFVECTQELWFYDTSAYVIKGKSWIDPTNRAALPGRNLQMGPPHWPEEPAEVLVEMDCVGCVTMVPSYAYASARYEDHPSYTDHFSICQAVRAAGNKVMVNRKVKVYHANLPNYGEAWH